MNSNPLPTIFESSPSRLRNILFPALFAALLAFGIAFSFAPKQSLWVDETTQLGGIHQTLPDLFRFLTGKPSPFDLLGVPADRMPPLSYLVDKAWATFAGYDELSLRHLGVLLFSFAVLLASLAAGFACPNENNSKKSWMSLPALASLITGLSLALCPSAVAYATEIRAYPLLMLLSSAGILSLVLALQKGTIWRQGLLLLILTAACYTHYYGVLLSGAVLTGYFVGLWQSGSRVTPALVMAALLGILLVGEAPFLLQAVDQSKGVVATPPEHGGPVSGFLKMLGRMAVHGSTRIFPHFSELAILCVGCLFFSSIVLALSKLADRRHPELISLVSGLLAGLTVVAAAGFIIHSFSPSTPSYNLWIPSFLYTIIGLTIGLCSNRWRPLLLSLWMLFLMTEIASSGFLATQGSLFAHGSHPKIAATVRALGANQVTILHAGIAAGFGKNYYPLRYDFGSKLPQYALTNQGNLGNPQLDTTVPELPLTEIKTPFVVLIMSRDFDSGELAQIHHSGILPGLDASGGLKQLEAAGFHPISSIDAPSFIGSRIIVLKQTSTKS